MSSKQHERTRARRSALQVMYQGEILGVAPIALVNDRKLVEETKHLDPYALSLLEGCGNKTDVLDGHIIKASENWALDRMPVVDRSLLRLSTYEMVYVDDVPISVSINEAVNLAKEFGGEESPRFVNGILGRIALQLEEEVSGD